MVPMAAVSAVAAWSVEIVAAKEAVEARLYRP